MWSTTTTVNLAHTHRIVTTKLVYVKLYYKKHTRALTQGHSDQCRQSGHGLTTLPEMPHTAVNIHICIVQALVITNYKLTRI